jgi:hypothetical protein
MIDSKNNFHGAVWAAFVVLLAGLAAAAPAEGQESGQGSGQAVVTVLPKHEGEMAPSVTNQDLSVKVNGKNGKVTEWTQFKGPDPIELVLLIDDSARTSLGTQMNEISDFIKTLPPNIKASVAYMQNGRAVFAAPLSADHDTILKSLRLPGGSAGTSASPYFSLSDLAKHWPSPASNARREVLMVTDGVDRYQMHYDPDDPYVQAAIDDAVRAHLVVYSIYWLNRGRADATGYENNAGQNLLLQVAQATGGKSFWEGMGNPVSFTPYLDELTRRFHNQYELGFSVGLSGKPEVETFKLKLSAPGGDVTAPQKVLVAPEGSGQK